MKHIFFSFFLACSLLRAAATELPEYKIATGERDKKRMELLNETYNPASKAFLKKVLADHPGNVLEIGCGIGIMSQYIAEINSPYKVTAIDSCKDQIAIASTIHNAENLEYKVANGRDILLSGKKFDVIYLRFVLVHLDNLSEIVKQLKNALTPDGIIVIEDVELADSEYVNNDPVLNTEFLAVCKGLWGRSFPKKCIEKALTEQGCKTIYEESFRPELKTAAERKLLTWGLLVSKNALLENKTFSEDGINRIIRKAELLENDNSKTVHYFKMFQKVAQ